jgi:hypothetical protein
MRVYRQALFKRRGDLSASLTGGWREAKTGDVHSLAQWPEIRNKSLAEVGNRQIKTANLQKIDREKLNLCKKISLKHLFFSLLLKLSC